MSGITVSIWVLVDAVLNDLKQVHLTCNLYREFVNLKQLTNN